MVALCLRTGQGGRLASACADRTTAEPPGEPATSGTGGKDVETLRIFAKRRGAVAVVAAERRLDDASRAADKKLLSYSAIAVL